MKLIEFATTTSTPFHMSTTPNSYNLAEFIVKDR